MTTKPGDILRNHVKEKLARDEVVASMTVRLVHGVEIARIAKTAGFDSLYVDMEHSSFSLESMSQVCIAALEVGITPFVRVPGTGDVQRILDAGALGIIAPHVQSAAEARDYVKAAKYPPLGDRSNAGNLPHLQYRSFPAAEAYAAVDAATMVIVQFESAKAVENAGEIVAVEGVDMVLIGTNDLLADWGLPGQYDHPRVRDAYEKTIAACGVADLGVPRSAVTGADVDAAEVGIVGDGVPDGAAAPIFPPCAAPGLCRPFHGVILKSLCGISGNREEAP